jgi:hypothetical protein
MHYGFCNFMGVESQEITVRLKCQDRPGCDAAAGRLGVKLMDHLIDQVLHKKTGLIPRLFYDMGSVIYSDIEEDRVNWKWRPECGSRKGAGCPASTG